MSKILKFRIVFFVFSIFSLSAYGASPTDSDQKSVLIVMPAYNAENTIAESIESVIHQTYQNWRLVVVDDGSTDRTVDLLKAYAARDKRIEFIQHEENSGSPAVARNTGLNSLRESHVAFLDSDDLWMPNKLTNQLDFMSDHDLDFSFTSFRVMNENGSSVGELQSVPHNVSYREILGLNPIALSSVVIDVSRVGQPVFTNEVAVEDYILWLQLLRQDYKGGGLQEDLMRYRMWSGSLSANKIKMAQRRWKVFRVHEQLGLFNSSFYFTNYAIRTFYRQFKRRLALKSQEQCEPIFSPSYSTLKI